MYVSICVGMYLCMYGWMYRCYLCMYLCLYACIVCKSLRCIHKNLQHTWVGRHYLEIGCNDDFTFTHMKNLEGWNTVVGVDPMMGGNVRMTSDEFFRINDQVICL